MAEPGWGPCSLTPKLVHLTTALYHLSVWLRQTVLLSCPQAHSRDNQVHRLRGITAAWRVLWESTGGYHLVVAVQSLNHLWLFATPWTAALQASLCFTISWSLFRFVSIELVMLSNHLILCCPLLLLPSWIPFMDHNLIVDKGTCITQWSYEMSLAVQGHQRQTGHSGEFWQNVVHWRKEWQTTPVFLLREPRELHELS